MSEPVIIIIISATIGAIIGPIIMLLIQKYFTRNKDDTDLVINMQKIMDSAVEALRKEKEASAQRDATRSEEYNRVQERLQLVERATYGPFRITLDFTTHPLGIQNQKIELIVMKDEKGNLISPPAS